MLARRVRAGDTPPMPSDWKIRQKEEGCAACKRPFEAGEEHFSILLVGPEALGREDRCVACFEAAEEAPGIFWRTRRRDAGRRLAVDFESIERLFLALEGRSEERLAELRYLLALLLIRKKRLKLVRVLRREGAEFLVLRRPRRDEQLHARVFDLTPERARELRDDLERIVEGAGAEDLLADEAATDAGEDPGEGAGEDPDGAPATAGAGDGPSYAPGD